MPPRDEAPPEAREDYDRWHAEQYDPESIPVPSTTPEGEEWDEDPLVAQSIEDQRQIIRGTITVFADGWKPRFVLDCVP